MKAILLVGHGSRSQDAKEIFNKVVEGLRKKTDVPVESCYMEISDPKIRDVIGKMYNDGVRDMIVLPYFLFKGIHIKEDIPRILTEMKSKWEGLKITLAQPIEYHDLILEILLERLEGEKTCI